MEITAPLANWHTLSMHNPSDKREGGIRCCYKSSNCNPPYLRLPIWTIRVLLIFLIFNILLLVRQIWSWPFPWRGWQRAALWRPRWCRPKTSPAASSAPCRARRLPERSRREERGEPCGRRVDRRGKCPEN